ncbi:nucleotide-binding domain-containing protein [Cryphonectria parasitica EP155]|uniref:Nucleotide-binding domain-containing protein n=1 Tax=Cryphonectria parasitica (strain ATCC 38755 / EP155) TaxID=660469 RepID=A0A9P4Y1D6_CRYP1|nr:nucleotide-binding domain-containing protein [Cryphonectria parasitica EP155]KAF3764723.1 nucleotide-binding domain-containing protein [Cryphonectria parasitica EP155]
MSSSPKTQQIIVIGAGVTGLSCALDLQEAGHTVTLLARDFPAPFALIDAQAQINYTSPWGGAHNRWVPPPPPPPPATAREQGHSPQHDHAFRDHRLALATFHRMRRLAAAHPEAGITFMKGIEYLEKPGPEYLALVAPGSSGPGSAAALGVEGFRVLGRDELPDDRVVLGLEYDTWCVNPMVYCSFLLNSFVHRGGRVVKREVRAPEEVFALRGLLGGGGSGAEVSNMVVVNASGQGFGDEKCFITRGQTCLVANKCDATVTRQNADGSWTFCVPRNFDGGTIIGGTKEPDNWDPEPSREVRDRLVRAFVATYPGIADEAGSVTVLKDIVGRRPTRHGGARIEREEVDGGPGRTIVHAYGLGGRGYEMSWGVAEMVARLVEGAEPTRARI